MLKLRKNEDILKLVSDRIADYPTIKETLFEQIRVRCKSPYAARNPLIALFLRGCNEIIHDIENGLVEIRGMRNKGGPFFDKLVRISGNRLCDQVLKDTLYELSGYLWLRKNGLDEIEFLPETDPKSPNSKSKTVSKKPDFKAKRDQEIYLIEVKSQRDYIGTLICEENDVYELTWPELAKDHKFSFEFGGYDVGNLTRLDYENLSKIPEILWKLASDDSTNYRLAYDADDTGLNARPREIDMTASHFVLVNKKRNTQVAVIDDQLLKGVEDDLFSETCLKVLGAALQIAESSLHFDKGLILVYMKLNHDRGLATQREERAIRIISSVKQRINSCLAECFHNISAELILD